MSEHIWAQEQIASYLTGGLDAAERERLDRHAKECPECAAALEEAIHFDRGLGTLFAPLRPKPGLEDRAMQATRTAPKPHAIFFLGWPRRITAAAAAIIVLTTFGALAASLMTDGKIPLPGQVAASRAPAAPVTLTPDLAGGEYSPHASNIQTKLSDEPFKTPIDDLDKLAAQTNAANRGLTKTISESDVKANDLSAQLQSLTDENRKLRELNKSNDPAASQFAFTANNIPKNPSPFNSAYNPENRGFNLNGVLPNTGLGGGGFAGNGAGINALGNNAYPQQQSNQLFNFYSGYGNAEPQQNGQGVPPGPAVRVAPIAPAAGPAAPKDQPTNGNGKPATGSMLYFNPIESSYKGGDKNEKGLGALKGDKDKDLKEELQDLQQLPKPGDPKAPPPPAPGTPAPRVADPVPAPVVPEPTRRVVLRSGDIEFELESFDSGLATVTKLVNGIKGAFVGTVNSDKLANGKVKGSVVVRVPPESLDGLVLDLRKELGKGGELKSVRLASQDVTKQFTDTESRLRAARAMETRLLKIIQDGKGEIKQLLEAERELGTWRTKIEEAEGELRYFASHAALSTLTITLMEKEIRAAAEVAENERVQAGVEVEDVDKAYQSVLKEILDAKGRVLKSELKQLTAGQFNALLNFEVSPETAGPIRDRLRQLGRVARLEIDRQQQAEGGTMPKNAPVKRGDTLFIVQLYNLANIAPRETAAISIAVADVPAAYNAIRDAIAKAAGRVQVAQLNDGDKANMYAQLDFDVRRTEEGGIRAAVTAAGETTSRNSTRAAENDQTTDTKILYRITLVPAAKLRPRDAIGLQIGANDVAATYTTLRETVLAAKGRITASSLNENDKQNVNASIDFEVRRAEEPVVKAALDAAGELLTRQIAHAPENEAATDAKILYNVRLQPANRLPPRETTVLGLEVQDVEQTAQYFTAQFNEAKGRQIDAKTGRERNGKATARLVYEVPLAAAAGLVERFKNVGTVRALNTSRDPQAPEGRSAMARIEITLGNTEGVVGPEDGVWPPVKKGLSYSFSVLLTSLTWVVFGLCVVLPWALVGYGGWRVVKRVTRSNTAEMPAVPPPATTHENTPTA